MAACNCSGACFRGEGCSVYPRGTRPHTTPYEVCQVKHQIPQTVYVGQCSICGGKVVRLYTAWIGRDSTRAWCEECGAKERTQENGHVVDMVKGT